MLRLIPAVETPWGEQPFEWARPETKKDWIELGAACSDDDVALIVAILASYNKVTSSGSIPEVVRALELAPALIAPGGLMVRSGEFEIAPSCCCGLEGWREWYQVEPNGGSPWLGHTPTPWVECKSDEAVFWEDEDLGDQSPKLSVSYSEVATALGGARAALEAFERRLADWLALHAPQSLAFSRRFAEAFRIAPAD